MSFWTFLFFSSMEQFNKESYRVHQLKFLTHRNKLSISFLLLFFEGHFSHPWERQLLKLRNKQEWHVDKAFASFMAMAKWRENPHQFLHYLKVICHLTQNAPTTSAVSGDGKSLICIAKLNTKWLGWVKDVFHCGWLGLLKWEELGISLVHWWMYM